MTKNAFNLAGVIATLRSFDRTRLNDLLFEFVARGNVPAVNALLDAGAAVDAKDAIGQTPLHLAALKGHTTTAAALMARGAVSDAKDNRGEIPLHVASLHGHSATAKLLKQPLPPPINDIRAALIALQEG